MWDHTFVIGCFCPTLETMKQRGSSAASRCYKCVYFMLAKSTFALHTEILAVESSQLIFGASARLLLYLATCQTSSLGNCKASIFSWFASENRCAWCVYMAALHEEIQEQGMLMKNLSECDVTSRLLPLPGLLMLFQWRWATRYV